MKNMLMSLFLYLIVFISIFIDSLGFKAFALLLCLPIGIRDFIRTPNREYRIVLSILLVVDLCLLYRLVFEIF